MDPSCFISEEEENALLSGTFIHSPKTIEDHILDLEMSIREMDVKSALEPGGHLQKAFARLHSKVEDSVLENLRTALRDVPDETEGLEECKKLVESSSKGMTLQDVLMVQYVLNGGLIMRQNHGSDDEYQVDIQ
jgi:hypothetical protein